MEGGTYQMQDSAMGSFGPIAWLIVIGCYLFFAWCHYRVAQKAGCEATAWYAYLPIMNILLMCQTARKPAWWFFLMLIPIANAFVMAYLWAETAKYMNQPSFWGWLMLIPFVNVISLLYLAFASSAPSQPTPPKQPQPRQPAGVA